MSHLHKVILVVICVMALFYFDSKEETTNARNNSKFHADSDIRIRIGNSSLRSVCFLATKRKRTRVKCPVCEKWVRDLKQAIYNCTNSNIKRALIFTYKGRT